MELFKLQELQDLFVDGCVIDESGNLLFLSIYGRDTSTQQLMASFSLPVNGGGLDKLTLVGSDGEVEMIARLGDRTRLEKLTGRLPRENLFGNLTHSWIYDPVCTRPDRVNRKAWLLADESNGVPVFHTIWETVKFLSPLPLMDHWQKAVLDAVCPVDDDSTRYVGRLTALRISLPDKFESIITDLVKRGALGLLPSHQLIAA
jgi:hypothetical protein